ncbi:ribosomal RNA-processing protein 14-like [Cynara cardunculus var. scolymus]|uniref:ribosomal RNA-processing protein 14-like n=1 Tax=Cynara cardunculus var. scolymus TaxID=59895 RepID=UPI000D62FE76|nr:ribosomal RNA-processing protein 14-like [Cynara cardunculus var. scolymus]
MKNLSTTSPTVDTAAAAAAADLKTLIHDHDQFFDKLIELIPAKFYLPTDEDSKPWFQGLSKGKKASLKQQTRENIKKSRRDRLDPEKAQTTTLDLLKKIVSRNEDSDEEQEEIEIIVKPVNKSVSYEELRRRLHSWKAATEKAMEVKVHDDPMLLKSAGKWKEREEILSTTSAADTAADLKRKREDYDKSGGGGGSGSGKENFEADFEFGKVKLGDEDGSKKKGKKGSKVKELEKAKKLKEAKKEDVVVAKKHSWKAATEKAMGVKVHDDPKLLKRSLQKEKKRREKSAGKWKEREETVEKMREEKQAKRRGNVEERASQKKMRKIAKREKKLMRPGFKGRKDLYKA